MALTKKIMTPRTDQNKTTSDRSRSELYDLYAPAVYGRILSIVHKGPIADKILENIFINAFNDRSTLSHPLRSALISMLNKSREESYKTIRALNLFTECCAGSSIGISKKS
jgi:hypothetical protein